jgi:hypothetical protein
MELDCADMELDCADMDLDCADMELDCADMGVNKIILVISMEMAINEITFFIYTIKKQAV